MNIVDAITFVMRALMVLCLTCVWEPVAADVGAECRQEAQDFEIMPELREEYINGCIESRGGVSTSATPESDYVPLSGSGDSTNTETDEEYIAE